MCHLGRFVALAAILWAAPVFAQQAQPSAEIQALSGMLMEQINSNASYRTQLIQAQGQIKALTEENAKLKASVKAEAQPKK